MFPHKAEWIDELKGEAAVASFVVPKLTRKQLLALVRELEHNNAHKDWFIEHLLDGTDLSMNVGWNQWLKKHGRAHKDLK